MTLSKITIRNFREKRLSPRRASGRSLLPFSPKRTQVRPLTCLATPDPIRTHGRPSVQEYRLRLKRPTPCVYARVPLYIKLNPRPLLALATSASFRGSLRFRPKNMAHHIFRLETELQNIPEAAPKASPSFSVSGKLAGPRSLIRLYERRL